MPAVVNCTMITKKCTKINLEGNWLSKEGIAVLADALKNNTILVELELANNCFCNTDLQILTEVLTKDNSTLQYLGLSTNRITDDDMAHMTAMLKVNRTLTKLALGHNKIGSRGIEQLADALCRPDSKLQEPSLSNNKSIGNCCVESLENILRNNYSLKLLNVQSCNISEKHKSRLKQLAGWRWYYTVELLIWTIR